MLFLGGSESKESCDAGNLGLIPGSVRSLGEENGNPLQYSCLENSHVQRSLSGYTPWSCKQLDVTGHDWATNTFTFHFRYLDVCYCCFWHLTICNQFWLYGLCVKEYIVKLVLIYWNIFKFCACNMNLYRHWKQRTFICVLDFDFVYSISLFFVLLPKITLLNQYISMNFTS